MLRSAVLAVTERQLTNKVVTETTVGRTVAKRFVAGEELAEAIAVAVALNQAGMVVSLDHLGEHVSEIGEAERATSSYLLMISMAGWLGRKAPVGSPASTATAAPPSCSKTW